MVITVAAGEEVFVNHATRCHNVCTAKHCLFFQCSRNIWSIGVDTGASHIAAHVAAAIHSTHMAFNEFNPSAVADIAHLASTVKIINQNVRTVHLYMGTIFHNITVDDERTSCAIVVGEAPHVACVAAAINRAHAA